MNSWLYIIVLNEVDMRINGLTLGNYEYAHWAAKTLELLLKEGDKQ